MKWFEQAVTAFRGQTLANELGIKFFETSAKRDSGIDETLLQIAKAAKIYLAENPHAVISDNTADDGVYNYRPETYQPIGKKHDDEIRWVAWSPDGKYIASCSGGDLISGDRSNNLFSLITESPYNYITE